MLTCTSSVRRLRFLAWAIAAPLLLLACEKPTYQSAATVDTAPPPGGAPAAPKTLNVFMWSEYMDPAIVSDFEKATGLKLRIDVYEDTESMLAKVQHQEGDRFYDLLVVSDHAVPVLARLKLIRPLDRARLANLGNVAPRFRSAPYDPDGSLSVPYQWGTLGLVYRVKDFPGGVSSWSTVLSPAAGAKPFVLIDSMRDMMGAALRAQGRGVNETDPAQLAKAADAIAGAKSSKSCLGFEGSVGGKNKVAAELASIAISYSGDALRAVADDPGLAYVIPREGSVVWVDAMVVTARAPNPDGAHAFIDFLLKPEVGARLSNFTRFASPNEAARPQLRPEDRDNPALYPPEEVIKSLEFLRDLGADTRSYDELWTRVKAR